MMQVRVMVIPSTATRRTWFPPECHGGVRSVASGSGHVVRRHKVHLPECRVQVSSVRRVLGSVGDDLIECVLCMIQCSCCDSF